MKPKLTKAQKARVKRSVVADLRLALGAWFDHQGTEHVLEARRLWRIAIAAVRKSK